MKRFAVFTTILFSFIFTSLSLRSFAGELPTVALQGKGTVKLEPNRAEILFQVITTGKELTSISEENRAIMERVTNTVNSLKIKKENIKTTEYSINKIAQFGNNGSVLNSDGTPIYSYEVRNGFLVTVENIVDVAKFISAFEKAGVNGVNNVTFYSSREEKSQGEGMVLAYKDAYSKALLLAKEAGFKSVSPKELNYDYFPVRRTAPFAMDGVAMKGAMEMYTPQSLDFTVNVRAIFNMEK